MFLRGIVIYSKFNISALAVRWRRAARIPVQLSVPFARDTHSGFPAQHVGALVILSAAKESTVWQRASENAKATRQYRRGSEGWPMTARKRERLRDRHGRRDRDRASSGSGKGTNEDPGAIVTGVFDMPLANWRWWCGSLDVPLS